MKTVFLTSGPRGAGKSTYIRKAQLLHPEVECISRDEILIELFGNTMLNPYTGESAYGHYVFKERLQERLSKDGDIKIIIDYWNGSSGSRKGLIKLLRSYGADKVICWQFAVSLETCLKWFFQKTDSKGYSETGYINDYRLYYRTAKDIEEDGFDGVRCIDPCQLTFEGFPVM